MLYWILLIFPLLGFANFCEKEKEWLKQNSLLFNASFLAKHRQETKENPTYSFPKPYAALDISSNWLFIDPHFVKAAKGKSVFSELQEEKVWSILQNTGLNGVHFASMQLCAEVKQVQITPSLEGFQPISYLIDPFLGSYPEYENLVQVLQKQNFSLIGTLLPFYTGRGFDFQLALRNYEDYPSLYQLVEIAEKDWDFLPKISYPKEFASLPFSTCSLLQEKGYIIGSFKNANWCSTSPVKGYDGKLRRWIYVYHEVEEAPLLQGLSPSFSSQRVLAGSLLSSLYHEKNSLVQIASTPPLGIQGGASIEKTLPFSLTYSDLLAQMTRQKGGFSFQKIFLSSSSIQTFLEYGPEFAYDFGGRSAFFHALLQKRTDLLVYLYQELSKKDFPFHRFIHPLQIEEGLSYSWADLEQKEEELLFFNGEFQKKKEVRRKILLQDLPLLQNNSFVAFSDKTLYSTTIGLLASCLKICDLQNLSNFQKEQLKKLHLLFSFFSAMQPGVFSLSMWDLVGALPLCKQENPSNAKIGKGALSFLPEEGSSYSSTIQASTLYPPLTCQAKDKNSFIQKLKAILKVRNAYHIERATFLGPVKMQNPTLFAYLLKLPSTEYLSLVVLNFSEEKQEETLTLPELQNVSVIDLFSRKAEKKSPKEPYFKLEVPPYEGRAFLLFSKGI